MPTYSSAHFAHALDQAFRRILKQQPRQTLPTDVLLDGLSMFVGGKLCDMARASNLSPRQHEEMLATFERNLGHSNLWNRKSA
jgi:hypothetical protein